jgi:hypothetical protein
MPEINSRWLLDTDTCVTDLCLVTCKECHTVIFCDIWSMILHTNTFYSLQFARDAASCVILRAAVRLLNKRRNAQHAVEWGT